MIFVSKCISHHACSFNDYAGSDLSMHFLPNTIVEDYFNTILARKLHINRGHIGLLTVLLVFTILWGQIQSANQQCNIAWQHFLERIPELDCKLFFAYKYTLFYTAHILAEV